MQTNRSVANIELLEQSMESSEIQTFTSWKREHTIHTGSVEIKLQYLLFEEERRQSGESQTFNIWKEQGMQWSADIHLLKEGV